MNNIFIVVILLTTLSALSSCKEETSTNPSVNLNDVSGTYQYRGYDSNQDEIVSGTFQIHARLGVITGSRNLMLRDSTRYAFETGQGEIRGSIDSSGNVILLTESSEGLLEGRFVRGIITGSRLSAFATVPPTPIIFGSFVATKIRDDNATTTH